ncbi:MAG: BatD family protein [Rhodanobacter sp.]|jgi:hypothetical protein|nr:BatD family protein [Rhodanobacter sp.]
MMPKSRMAWAMFMALALVLSAATVHAAGVRAWFDRDTIRLGETVILNVEVDGSSDAQPDFTALTQDFELTGTQFSQQNTISNGAHSAKTLWAVGLEPKHEGNITVGPITVGNEKTAPIRLNVLAAETGAAKQGGDAFLEVSAEPLTPYVQQQVQYTIKLHFAFDLPGGNGSLTEPQADGIGVQRLGQDKMYVTTVGERRYRVVERHYVLTPERSGALTIPAIVYLGNVPDVTDPSGVFNRGRNVSARSEPVKLDVKAKPAQWTEGPWLPAASLQLRDESTWPAEVHVGDPVTRAIRLQAQGLGFEQLPELNLAAPDGVQMYPDKADAHTRDDGLWLYGERARKFAFVPQRAGTLTIPGLRVRWWDTVHDRAETAELPPRTVRVLPAVGTAAAAPEVSDVSAPSFMPTGSVRVWQALTMLGFALWLATLALYWRRRRPPVSAASNARVDTSGQRAAFLRACALGDLAGAERALVAWAKAERGDVRNLGELAERLADSTQRETLADTQRARYAGAACEGLAMRLERAFKPGFAWHDHSAAHTEVSALPALYPARD